jgi:2-oxoacid:acceptor oxidoreductase gamma subunit (pyruvate/2-ketoisovalerate family)/2-oxoacid:acceptor oxidoreductase delta subunit (pyruvate/2-ketoisovalerate family)
MEGIVIEIRFHGRGGQGAVIASELLAQAAFLDGKMPQSFPFFGVERRGAPVTAFTRIDDHPIGVRTSIVAPDVVVVLDPGLLLSTPVTDGLKPGGLLLVNTASPAEQLRAPPGVHRAAVDATRIALAHGLGTTMLPIVNTAVLGALARTTGVVSLEALSRAIEQFVPARPRENSLAARDGYTKVLTVDGGHAPFPQAFPAPASLRPFPEGPMATLPSETIHTAAWRTFTPVIHLERCTKCNFCWKFCPDDAIEFDASGFPKIRMEYCKGCGICAVECPPKTIEMIAEA